MSVDQADRVIGFHEKPESAPDADAGATGRALASMGIYIFKADVLVRALEDDAVRPDSQHDFGRTSFRRCSDRSPVFAYRFYDENKKSSKYWRDIGTLDAYFEASMDLCQVNPEFNLYDPEWPLRTYQPQAPPREVRLRRRGPPMRAGARLDDLGRLHHLGQPRGRAASCARTSGCTASATSNRRS